MCLLRLFVAIASAEFKSKNSSKKVLTTLRPSVEVRGVIDERAWNMWCRLFRAEPRNSAGKIFTQLPADFRRIVRIPSLQPSTLNPQLICGQRQPHAATGGMHRRPSRTNGNLLATLGSTRGGKGPWSEPVGATIPG